MWTLLLTTIALAAAPPQAVLDDLDRWEGGMDALIDGPADCWAFKGTATQVVTYHPPPDLFSAARPEKHVFTGPFTGTLDQGRWRGLTHEVTEIDGDIDFKVPLYPLIGDTDLPESKDEDRSVSITIGGDDNEIGASLGETMNLLEKAVDEWSGNTETALAQWDGEENAVLLLREIPVSPDDDRPIKVTVRFPDGEPLADRVDAVWPKLVKVGEWPFKVKFRDAQAHVIGYVHGGQVLPRLESTSLTVAFIGFTVGYEQRLQFTSAERCPAGPPPSDVDPSPGPQPE